MNRINFVGNALFIPFFLIGVGMLIDFSVLFKGLSSLKVAGVMIVLATGTKYLAAWVTQKTYKLSIDERSMIFGLSVARVGASLAIVLVGYNIILGETITGEPIRLLNEDVLNGTILMILVTCTVSSLVVEKSSRKLALLEENKPVDGDEAISGRILISLAYPDTVPDLVELALLIKPHKSDGPIYALHVVDEQDVAGKNHVLGKKMMDHAIRIAAGSDNTILPIARFDMNIANGIIYTIKEHNITDVIIGLHHRETEEEHFFGPVAERILSRTAETIFIYKAAQPVNTLDRIVVAVPPKAEYELGFHYWFERVQGISRDTGLPLTIYANPETIQKMRLANHHRAARLKISFKEFADWEEFLIFSREIKKNDLFIIISSRRGYLSYQAKLEKLPYFLTSYFKENSFIIVYPKQLDADISTDRNMEEAIAQPVRNKSAFSALLEIFFNRRANPRKAKSAK